VSAFRALAVAHLQSTWNRLRKQMGTAALWVFIGVLLFLAVTVALPMLGSLGLLGWAAGHALGGSETERAIGLSAVIFSGITLVLGIIGGISSGSRQLPWETLRGFPVRSFTLFLAECFAGAGEVITLFELCALGVVCLGASVGAPWGAPFFLVLFLTHAVALLALQQLFGSLAQRLSRQLRAMLVLLPIAAVSMSYLAPLLAKYVTGNEYVTWGDRLARVQGLFPAGWTMRAAHEVTQGQVSAAAVLGAVVFPVVLAGLLLVAAWQFVAREKPLAIEHDRTRPVRLWSFRSQLMGVARLQWESLSRSLPGRFGLVMPLLTLVLIRGPLAELIPGRGWTAPIAFGYASLAGTNLLFNQFGLDRHGVKVLFLLPVEPLALLRGKLLGFAAWQAVQAGLLAGLLALTGRGEPGELVIGVLLYADIFLILAMVGQFASIWQPRPLRKNGLRAAQPPLVLVLMMFGTLGTAGGLLYGVLSGLKRAAPDLQIPVLLGVGVALFALAFPIVAFNAVFLERSREKLVEVLGSAG
jgi:hypothetical protein